MKPVCAIVFRCVSIVVLVAFWVPQAWGWNSLQAGGSCKQQTTKACRSTIGNAGGQDACCDPRSSNIADCASQNPCQGGRPYRWVKLPLGWTFNPNNMAGKSGYTGSTETDLEASLKKAWDAWTKPDCTGFAHKYEGKSTTRMRTNDNKLVLFLPTTSEWAGMGVPSSVLAFTRPIADNITGNLLDADIAFNPSPSGRRWGVLPNVQSTQMDFADVAAHEIGHALGFGHTAPRSALMYYAVRGVGPLFNGLSPDEVDGICKMYPITSCTQSAQCGACRVCTNNACKPKQVPAQVSTCKACASDADCNGGACFRTPNGFRCFQPCDNQGCCPEDTYCSNLSTPQGTKRVCVPFRERCPALTCASDKECGPGEYCENKLCLPRPVSPSASLCQPCKEQSDCNTKDSFCYGIPGNQRCTQPCNQGEFCPPGYECQELYPGFAKQCIPREGGCEVPCMFSSHCPAEDTCLAGVCSSKQGSGYAEACDPTPCKEPFVCAQTISGKRCLQPCGIPPGFAGSPCINANSCKGGSGCFSLNSGGRICLQTCRSNLDCASKGGGVCSRGVCQCSSDSQCGANHTCNRSSGVLGACAPKAENKTCKDQHCVFYDGTGYCVDLQPGPRPLGGSCDPLNRCQQGLVCLNTWRGGTCFQECKADNDCLAGSRCISLSSNTRVCACTAALGCPPGRTCSIRFQQYGICEVSAETNACVSSQECPEGYLCFRGQCVAAEGFEYPPEPAPEPKPEPATAEPAPEPEPVTLADEPPMQEEAAVDAGEKAPEPADTGGSDAQLGGGCGCQSSPHTPAPLVAILVLFALLFRRNTKPFATVRHEEHDLP